MGLIELFLFIAGSAGAVLVESGLVELVLVESGLLAAVCWESCLIESAWAVFVSAGLAPAAALDFAWLAAEPSSSAGMGFAGD
jgi:hypothetical protein